ncbi:allophanate hydrolase subunit 1 [uncultured Jatrophihabitans sp.]|uniref:5-oxoprolinase subunit B family protein n=1 Tax=uncultured Jatrophihabitans sp. TaxID=1610747 RepID=UPI0035CA3626
MRLLPCGMDGVLVEVDDVYQVVPLAETLRADVDVVETVPGARTVLVRTRREVSAALRERITAAAAAGTAAREPAAVRDVVELTVRYDGPDLRSTAAELDMTPDELIAVHSGREYVVAFCGFAPGFAYVTGLDERLHVARLAEPRTRVPAGSVGVAGEFTGVYPRESPGGWRLLGRTEAQLWDATADPPALLVPGTPVRFRPS